MKKVLKKMIVIFILSMLTLSIVNIIVLASSPFDRDAITNISDAGEAGTATENMLKTALAITKVITTGIALIMLTILGTKYMIASPGERAEIKKHAVVYVVGAVIMFSATGILSIIEGFTNNIKVS